MSVNAAGRDVQGAKNPNWKGGKVEKECLVCHTHFLVSPGRTTARYCSLQCVGLSQRGKPVAVRQGRAPKPQQFLDKECPICHGIYQIRETHGKGWIKKFCSKSCQFLWRSQHHRGEANPNWRGGLSRLPYPFNWPAASQAIRIRDGNVCLNPSCHGAITALNIHHIDYDKTNLDPFNLITVCLQCNARANYRREWWKQHYESVQYSRGLLPSAAPALFPARLERASRKGEKHPLAILTEPDVVRIRSDHASGVRVRVLAQRYGVSEGTISLIVHRKTWSHL